MSAHGNKQQEKDHDRQAQSRTRSGRAPSREADEESGEEAAGDTRRASSRSVARTRGCPAARKSGGHRSGDAGVRRHGQDRCNNPAREVRMTLSSLALLEAEARFHRERLALYRARRYGGRPPPASLATASSSGPPGARTGGCSSRAGKRRTTTELQQRLAQLWPE